MNIKNVAYIYHAINVYKSCKLECVRKSNAVQ